MILQKNFYLLEKEYFNSFVEKLETMDIIDENSIFSINGNDDDEKKDILSLDNNGNANIKILGPLWTKDSLWSWFFGGVTYPKIIDALKRADENPSVKKINLMIDSPGGNVDGVDNTAIAIRNVSKPIEAQIENLGASAAYWLASQADHITAMSPTTEIGSIGVITTYIDDKQALKERGYKRIILTSSDAPKKYNDPDTKEGQNVIINRLNEIHNIFVSRVAEGRRITPDFVNENFGKGDVLIASKALEVGMIDALENKIIKEGGVKNIEASYEASTSPFKDFDIVDKEWDADAAIQRVRRFTNSEDEPSSDYKLAFFWYNEKEPKNYGSYKLPFVDIDNGKMVAVRRGVFAANGAMQGARGGVDIPEKDRKKVQNHIDKYLKKIEKLDEEKESKKTIKGDENMDEKEKNTIIQEATNAERDRIVALKNWETHNPETKGIVEDAIISGKSVEDVMPQLLSAVKNTSFKIASTEGKNVNSAVKTKPVGASDEKEQEKEEGETEGDEDEEEGNGEETDLDEKDKAIAKAIAKSVVKGGNF